MNCCTLLLLTLMLALARHEILAQIGCKRRYMRRINGKCYYFSVMKLNWFGALNNCLRKGLVLAELASPLDFYGVVNFLISMGTHEDFWFAGNDLQTEGRFQYITTARLVRYFSNYSIVDPAEASDCDDCLEVRLRQKLSVVADDNCLERQYFICSERYCDPSQVPKKKLHHSHEHLHHFHHDIEVEDDNDGDDYNDNTFAVGSDGGADSEGPWVLNSVEEVTTVRGIVDTHAVKTEMPLWVGSEEVTEQVKGSNTGGSQQIGTAVVGEVTPNGDGYKSEGGISEVTPGGDGYKSEGGVGEAKSDIDDYKSEGGVGSNEIIEISKRPMTKPPYTRRVNKKSHQINKKT